MRPIMAILSSALLAGAANAFYDCGGYRFSAQYVQGTALVGLPDGRALMLRQGVAAMGTRYTDGTVTLMEQGGTARLELSDAVHPQCVPI
jgi:membrane-bound inhibitor of C-type lysozyme